jgi:PPP family 3-phenylpropionic acid transporter
MQSTAIALYAAAGGGLGVWFCTFIGGILMNYLSLQAVYLFYFLLTMGGLLLFTINIGIQRKERAIGKESA